jgi:hypothetical protein
MTSDVLGEIFKGYFADMCSKKFPLVSMGEWSVEPAREQGPGKEDPHRHQRKLVTNTTKTKMKRKNTSITGFQNIAGFKPSKSIFIF